MKIIIIEDEKLTAKDLAKTIQRVDADVEIIAILGSVRTASLFLKGNPEVDLIFSDIQLGDGLSFEIFEKLKLQIPIVFCTAYDKYALEAFQAYGIDYILKPFTKLTVAKALDKYQNLREQMYPSQDQYQEMIKVLWGQNNPANQAILIQQGEKIIPVQVSEVALFYAEDDYSFAFTFEEKQYLLSQKLEALEQQYSPGFFRANRQHLVNRQAIQDAAHYLNRKILINLKVSFKEPIIVGKLKTTAFLNWLAGK